MNCEQQILKGTQSIYSVGRAYKIMSSLNTWRGRSRAGAFPNRRPTPQIPPGQSTPRDGRSYAVFRRKTVSDSHFPPNRKQKYGGHPTNELAVTDFLFDFVYIMGSISTLNGILYPPLLPLAHYKGVFHLARISIACEFFLKGLERPFLRI